MSGKMAVRGEDLVKDTEASSVETSNPTFLPNGSEEEGEEEQTNLIQSTNGSKNPWLNDLLSSSRNKIIYVRMVRPMVQ